jgi:hypothetical protein
MGMPVIAQKTKHDGGELLFANSKTFIMGDMPHHAYTFNFTTRYNNCWNNANNNRNY